MLDPLMAVFGVGLAGELISLSLADWGPHWLVGGQTKSGKSVFMNALFLSVMYHNMPGMIQLFIIDPKKVEFAVYRGSPFCAVDPVTDMDDAYALVMYLCEVMDARYEKMAKVNARNLEEYNKWVRDNPDKASELGYNLEPYQLLICDEFADLYMQHSEVKDPFTRLGQKARAAGQYLFIATQKPTIDMLPSSLRANLPGRVGFRCTEPSASNVIIGSDACVELAGYGDGFVVSGVTGETIRFQSPYISSDEIESICEYLRTNYEHPGLVDYKTYLVEHCGWQWTNGSEDESKPYSERHVKEKRTSSLRGGAY